MNNRDIEWRRKKLKLEREKIESGQLNGIRELLPNEVIGEICEGSGYEFRRRLLTPLVTIFHMIGVGISREGTFQSAWQLSGQSGRSGPLAKARGRLPVEVWSALDQWIVREMEAEKGTEALWQGHRMLGVDGTCVSMSDEREFVKHFGRWGSKHGKSRFPLARVLTILDLKTLVTVKHELGKNRMSETGLLKEALPSLREGDVLVMDRLFAGAHLYVTYKRAGVDFINRAHAALQVERLRVVRELGKEDLLVELPIGAKYQREDQELPKTIEVRVIKVRVKLRGRKEQFWIVTSLLDETRYASEEIRMWYKKRWKVETLIEELKLWLGADILRSKTVAGVKKELYARVIGLNLIHWLILRAAKTHGQPVERLSVAATLRLTLAFSLKMSTAPSWQLPLLYGELLQHIAFSTVPSRPDRLEPRMQKREPRHYPRLKIPRFEWKAIYAQAA